MMRRKSEEEDRSLDRDGEQISKRQKTPELVGDTKSSSTGTVLQPARER